MLDPTTINHAPHRTAPRTPEMTEKALREATRRIAPLWPLDRFVAVNPYVGLVDLGVAEAAARLAATAGARGTLPPAYYLSAVDEGRITIADLQAAMAAADPAGTDTVDVFVDRCRAAAPGMDPQPSVPTVTRTATAVTGSDWARFSVERIAAWAAAYFDDGQAAWRSADRAQRPYASWLEEATADRTPEVMGLRGFRAVMRSLPGEPLAAAHIALEHLDVPDELLDTYLHAVLLQVGGWAAHAARIAFEADLAGQPDDDTLVQFLAIVLAWEHGLLRTLSTQGLSTAWTDAIHCASPDAPQPGLADKLVLQDALDRAERRRIAAQLSAPGGREHSSPGRAEAQAIFCIDVRSETYRRHLETGGDIETLGFAGFFGFAVTYVPLAHQHGAAQYPVLLTSGPTVVEVLADPATTDAAVARRRLAHHVARAWKSFKMGAVSCFSFVGPVGLGYLPKLFTDSYGRTRPIPTADVEGLGPWATGHKGPSLDASTSPSGPTGAGIGPEDRIRLAEGALRGLSLRTGLAPLVLIAGHGASTVNNPYETGLNCGACGGNTGEANARVAAAVLNDPQVRTGLTTRGIVVPDDTWFLAGLHDTTTDEVALFDTSSVPASHTGAVVALAASLAAASRATRAERAGRLGIAAGDDTDAAVIRRSTDWAQVRPEWGLAGCRAFIAAPRHRTARIDLEGRAFLHSYDWRQDEDFKVLELILTAPVVVASWINLQYYASTVEPRLFGSGNKTLHNVVGRLGVLEGNGGDLRTGLPWQSVHDGHKLQHEPLHLNVIIEAPLQAIDDALAGHEHIRNLCDHGWIHLLAMNDDGSVDHHYAGHGRWEAA